MPLQDLETRYFPSGVKDAAPFSRASTFEPIIDGPDYFGAIKAAIDGLSFGDACYIAGWALSLDFTFADGRKLGDLLVAKAAAGVDVRVIVWASRSMLDLISKVGGTWVGLQVRDQTAAGPFAPLVWNNVKAAEDLRGRDVDGEHVLARRVLMDWSGNLMSSHHMKFTVVARNGELVGFVGGLDYQQDRMSAPMHRPPPPPPAHICGVHEVGVRVKGEAAARVLATFATRWTEASTLSAATYDIGAGERQFNPPTLTTPDEPSSAQQVQASQTTSVQVLRSFPDSKEFGLIKNTPWQTLPAGGVHEVLCTFTKALDAARRYIYIEDQAFNAIDALFPSLVRACERGVRVIALIPGRSDPLEGAAAEIPPDLSGAVQKGIVNRLSDAYRTNLAVYQLRGIYVHAKVILIDDEFASIGSANFMDRSMQLTSRGDDSELSVAAVSTDTVVRELRVKLWAEHLRVTAPAELAEIRDLNRSLGFWRDNWGTGFTFGCPDSTLRLIGP
jgi:phosphatidylserine/phosphatidylglycerophosphate/cardiolipin synthase-like enzyme